MGRPAYLLPSASNEATASIKALSFTWEMYLEARRNYMTVATATTYTGYQEALSQLREAHRAWKSVMSKMIQGRQL